MTEDALLFAAALANPAEHTPRLVLADWYDERDEPDLAAALRASPEMVAFLSELTKWDTVPTLPVATYVNGLYQHLLPVVPAARLMSRHAHLFPVPPAGYSAWAEDAPEPTHTSSTGPVPPLHFLHRWQLERQDDIRALRELAARASAREQPPEFTEPADARAFEEQSCLLHELVVREREHAALPAAVAHAARMKERDHPLAWLPTRLLPTDALLPSLAMYFPPNGGYSDFEVDYGSALGATAVPLDAPSVITNEEFPPESPVFAAVRSWETDSNGRLEGRVFHLDRELTASSVSRLWFTRLPAASVNGSIAGANWHMNRMASANTLGALFGATQSGGAYGRGEFGAYGRLHAWQSLGALAGCAPEASIDEVAREVERCEWFSFGGSAWFDVIEQLNLGVICVRADRRTVALLAATDTD
jgi:uncharacterized protein (TIGR02996 family)